MKLAKDIEEFLTNLQAEEDRIAPKALDITTEETVRRVMDIVHSFLLDTAVKYRDEADEIQHASYRAVPLAIAGEFEKMAREVRNGRPFAPFETPDEPELTQADKDHRFAHRFCSTSEWLDHMREHHKDVPIRVNANTCGAATKYLEDTCGIDSDLLQSLTPEQLVGWWTHEKTSHEGVNL